MVGSVVEVVVVVGSVVDVVVVEVDVVEVDVVVVVGGGGHAEASDAPAGGETLPAMRAKPMATAAPMAAAWNLRLRTSWDAP